MLTLSADASKWLNNGDYDTAALIYDTLATEDPDYSDWTFLRGVANGGAGNLLDALPDFRNAATIKPDDPMVHFHRASARWDLGDDAGAARDCYRVGSGSV